MDWNNLENVNVYEIYNVSYIYNICLYTHYKCCFFQMFGNKREVIGEWGRGGRKKLDVKQ